MSAHLECCHVTSSFRDSLSFELSLKYSHVFSPLAPWLTGCICFQWGIAQGSLAACPSSAESGEPAPNYWETIRNSSTVVGFLSVAYPGSHNMIIPIFINDNLLNNQPQFHCVSLWIRHSSGLSLHWKPIVFTVDAACHDFMQFCSCGWSH